MAEVTNIVPEWDIADRMRKSMRHAGVGVQELADALEVTRYTVGNWINGHNVPRRRDLREIARLCGVDFDWLESGNGPTRHAGRPVRRHRRYTPWDSNPEPTVSGIQGPSSCDDHLIGVRNPTPRHISQRRRPRAA